MPKLVLRFDLRNPDFGASTEALYAACLDMSSWADERGFDVIQLSEHHAAEDGYLPSPLVLAAAILARTRRVQARSEWWENQVTITARSAPPPATSWAARDAKSG